MTYPQKAMAAKIILPKDRPSPIQPEEEELRFACGNEADFAKNREVLSAFVQFIYESIHRQSARSAWLLLRQFEPVGDESEELHLSSILKYLDERKFIYPVELFARAFISYTGKGEEPMTFGEFAELLTKFS